MRNFKVTLLLGVFSGVVIWMIVQAGCFLPLELIWKKLFPFSLVKPEETECPSIVFLCLISFLTVWVSIHLVVRRERLLLFSLTALLLVTGSLVLGLYHLAITPLPAIAALGWSYFSALLFLKTAVGSRYPRLQLLIGERLNRSLLRKLVNGETPVAFLGERKEGSLLVCSLNNSAELMELLKPEDYVAMTNLYLQTASDFLVEVGGYLEECSGESLRVIFGVPLPIVGALNHGAKATRAAYDLMLRLDELNYQCDVHWQQRLDVRIGINSGEMIAGKFGGTRLNHYSVAGPVVDFAAYLSAACHNYGCRMLVGPATYAMAESTIEFRPIDLLQRKGLRRRVELYEVLSPKQALSAERERSRNLFWRGVIFFREQEWDKAVEALTSARISGISDKALDLYLERIDRARRGGNELTPEQVILTEALRYEE
ncbi:MAG: adenylate/guanylate cyclase domain-containing protein [Verrucomicrobiae bacterium]|nr:adenylate/guanylate cyclase domain-containing protein [Verrucomicrobiae bacterium]